MKSRWLEVGRWSRPFARVADNLDSLMTVTVGPVMTALLGAVTVTSISPWFCREYQEAGTPRKHTETAARIAIFFMLPR
jgi:hypothetical protein